MALSKLSFDVQVHAYLEYLTVRNYSAWTIRRRRGSLKKFTTWCRERELNEVSDITKPILERYVRFLFYYRKPDGRPLGIKTQYHHIGVVMLFFRWMVRRDVLLANPASDIERPRLPQRLPKTIFSLQDVAAIMNVPDLETEAGLRDRAILETLFSTGMRRAELTNLDREDVDFSRELVNIRQGKGKKDRVVPVGERALDWIQRYLVEVRPRWEVDSKEPALFLNQYGARMSPDALSGRVTKYVKRADIGKSGSCHTFRHSMATLMLEGGADVRFVQQMLGHASLQATEIYTHVSVQQLKRVHARTHPTALRGRTETVQENSL